jgi:hypothetical protein
VSASAARRPAANVRDRVITLMIMPPGFNLSADVRYELVFSDQTEKSLLLAFGVGF